MKVLVVGNGGREHALCWKLRQSAMVTSLFVAPGNPGTAQIVENVAIKADDIANLVKFAVENKIDLVVVGPEQPLSLGLVDELKLAGVTVFGPTQAAAQLESSKSFAKEVMRAAGVDCAAYQVVFDRQAADKVLNDSTFPLVIKVDGLAAGKGVFVCLDRESANSALSQIYDTEPRCKAVIEEYLEGKEVSLIVACAGSNIVPLAPAHDYKRIFDDNEGPNTGGMGTVSPTPNLTDEQDNWAIEHVIVPVLAEMNRRGISFTGFLYAGLMIAPDGKINVLEFNCRLGDPETQVILPRLKSDLCEILFALAADRPLPETIEWSNKSCVCVVLASAGYPESSRSGDKIQGIKEAASIENVLVFQAGTAIDTDGQLITNGGRVLNVVGLGEDLNTARSLAYKAVAKIDFAGIQNRADIGA